MTDAEGRTGPAPGHRELRLDVPGGPVDLLLDQGLDSVADQLAVLWGHVVADDDGRGARRFGDEGAAADGDERPGRSAPVAELRYATAPTEGARTLAPHDPSACYKVSGDVTRAVIRALLGTRMLLHAGTVLLEGTGITMLVGASGAGKSTAAAVLGREGAYLSDELAIIDPDDLTVTAYPKPVSRVVHDRVKQDLALPDIGLRPVLAAGPVDTVVLLARDPDAEGASLHRVCLIEAAATIVAQSSSMWRLPDPLGAIARMLRHAGGALRARYRESTELSALLGAPPAAQAEPWETIEPEPPAQSPPVGAGLVGAPFVQALRSEGATLVLQTGNAVSLTGLAELVWDLVREHGPLDLPDLEERVIATVGENPDSARMIASAVAQVQEAGLILQD